MDINDQPIEGKETYSDDLEKRVNAPRTSAPSIFAGWYRWTQASSSFTEDTPAEPQLDDSGSGKQKPKKAGRKGKGRAADLLPDPPFPPPALSFAAPDPFFTAPGQSLGRNWGTWGAAVVEAKKSARELVMGNQDILGEIFNIISFELETPGNDASQSRKNLSYAARTCRIFTDPANNALWRVLPSLFPLLKLLPSFQLANNQYILPDVKPEEWGALEIFARRVRIIHYTHIRWSVSPLVYFRLSQLKASSLFPALKELRIPPNVNVDLFSPFCMMSPEMRRLEINGGMLNDPELFRPFFPFATTASPNITHLVLRGEVAIDLGPTFLFRSLHTLELHLSAQTYDTSFLRKLGHLTHLRTLTLFLGSLNDRNHNRKTLSTPISCFGQFLEILHLKGSLAAMPMVLQYISCKTLSAWTLEETNSHSHNHQYDSYWTECFEALSTSAESVKQITIIQSPPHNHVFSFKLVTYLRQLHNLEFLDIKNGHLTLSETDFLTLISAFPKLKRLSLPDTCNVSFPPISVLWQPSIIPETLEELRFCCFTNARAAQLPANLKDTKINRSVAHHGLRRLAISSSFHQIQDFDVIHLARLLDSAYPNLDVVEGYGPNAANGYESWGRVNLLRAALRDIRSEMGK